MDPSSHDLGSQVVYEYWLANGYQFGKQIIQNVGPLGFLLYPGIYSGFLIYAKFYALIIMAVSMTAVFHNYLQKLSFSHALVFYFSLVLIAFDIPYDVIYYTFGLLLSLRIVHAEGSRSFGQHFNLAMLAVLSLTKGTLLVWALFTLIVLLVVRFFRSQYMSAMYEVGVFSAFFVLFWRLCAQSIWNIPDFLYAMFSFSSGYNEAMAVYEKSYLTIAGFGLLGTYTFFVIYSAVVLNTERFKINVNQSSSAVLLLAILFLVWKHGYVRADGHVVVFLQFCLITGSLYLFTVAEGLQPRSGIRLWGVFLLIIFSVAFASCRYYKQSLPQVVQQVFKVISLNIYVITHFDENRNAIQQSLARLHMQQDRLLDDTRLNSQLVGYWGIRPGPFVYQNFTYHSAPSNVNFASWNAWIMQRNGNFYHNDHTAPDYLFVEFETIDNQLIAQNDAYAQREILHRYAPLQTDANYVLLKRNKHLGDFSVTQIGSVSGYLNAWQLVPNLNNHAPLWVEIEVKQSFLLKVVAFFYKPPQYEISLRLDNGSVMTKKFLPKTGAIGFMLNPLINNNTDFLAYYRRSMTNNPPKRVVQFNVSCKRMQWLCTESFKSTFSTINNL